MKVQYETPVPVRDGKRLAWLCLVCVAVLALAVGLVFVHQGKSASLLSSFTALGFLVGINSIAYETPVTGATAPTASQSRTHNVISAIVTGDGSAVTFTITHNWGLTTAQLAAGAFPFVEYEELLAAGYTAAPLITSKTANTVVFSCTGFTGAGLRVRITRPVPAEVIAPQV